MNDKKIKKVTDSLIITMTKDELQDMIIGCVNACLKYHKPVVRVDSLKRITKQGTEQP